MHMLSRVVTHWLSSSCVSHFLHEHVLADAFCRRTWRSVYLHPFGDDHAVRVRQVRWDSLSNGLVNDRCSSLVVLSGTSLSNLAALFAMTYKSMVV